MGNMVQPDVTGAVAVQDADTREAVHAGTWRFRLGQCVSHKNQSMPSLVVSRVRTTKGREIYGIRRQEECEVPDLLMLGDSLVDVEPDSQPCADCSLFLSSLCPGDMR